MSVLIKGMEVPKSCYVCPFCDYVSARCDAVKGTPYTPTSRYDTRAEWCPLIAVPDHGDLIDRDKLEKEANEALKKFKVAVASKPRWIPVTERLPDFEGAVLCMRKSYTHPGMKYQEIMYCDEYGFSNIDSIYAEPGNVTHWMPLPTPPKEETE